MRCFLLYITRIGSLQLGSAITSILVAIAFLLQWRNANWFTPLWLCLQRYFVFWEFSFATKLELFHFALALPLQLFWFRSPSFCHAKRETRSGPLHPSSSITTILISQPFHLPYKTWGGLLPTRSPSHVCRLPINSFWHTKRELVHFTLVPPLQIFRFPSPFFCHKKCELVHVTLVPSSLIFRFPSLFICHTKRELVHFS